MRATSRQTGLPSTITKKMHCKGSAGIWPSQPTSHPPLLGWVRKCETNRVSGSKVAEHLPQLKRSNSVKGSASVVHPDLWPMWSRDMRKRTFLLRFKNLDSRSKFRLWKYHHSQYLIWSITLQNKFRSNSVSVSSYCMLDWFFHIYSTGIRQPILLPCITT